jgi:hypothetical protein
MSDKVMIDLSNSKRMMMGGVGVAAYYNSMNMSTIIPDPTPMKEDRNQAQHQHQHQSPHRVSFSTGDVVDTKKKRKTVQFASNLPTKATTIPSSMFPTTILTEKHCNELWYQKDELTEIKKEAKELISRREDNDNKNDNKNKNSNRNNDNDDDDEDDAHEGLERFTRQRATWKRSSIYYILQAQKQVKERQGVNQEQQQQYLRNVSIQCSTWAKETALKQGFKDYCSIHDPLASLFASTTSDTTSSDASTSTSRRRKDHPKDSNKEEVGKGQEQQKRRQQQEQHYDELIFGTTSNNNNTNNSKKDCNTSNNIHNKHDRRPFKKRRTDDDNYRSLM